MTESCRDTNRNQRKLPRKEEQSRFFLPYMAICGPTCAHRLLSKRNPSRINNSTHSSSIVAQPRFVVLDGLVSSVMGLNNNTPATIVHKLEGSNHRPFVCGHVTYRGQCTCGLPCSDGVLRFDKFFRHPWRKGSEPCRITLTLQSEGPHSDHRPLNEREVCT